MRSGRSRKERGPGGPADLARDRDIPHRKENVYPPWSPQAVPPRDLGRGQESSCRVAGPTALVESVTLHTLTWIVGSALAMSAIA